jgi:hypothetical protein
MENLNLEKTKGIFMKFILMLGLSLTAITSHAQMLGWGGDRDLISRSDVRYDEQGRPSIYEETKVIYTGDQKLDLKLKTLAEESCEEQRQRIESQIAKATNEFEVTKRFGERLKANSFERRSLCQIDVQLLGFVTFQVREKIFKGKQAKEQCWEIAEKVFEGTNVIGVGCTEAGLFGNRRKLTVSIIKE